jgi:hypothetical protein
MPTIIDGTEGITFPNSTIQASAGQVLQVVNATTSTQVTTATTTYVDTGLTATITPKFATSKILVIASLNGGLSITPASGAQLRLLRNGSQISFIDDVALLTNASSANLGGTAGNVNYLDSPATTSATTYKIQFNSRANLVTMAFQFNSSTSYITLMEIAA